MRVILVVIEKILFLTKKDMSLEENRKKRALESKSSQKNILFGLLVFLVIFCGIVYLMTSDSLGKKNYTICECAEIYKKELLGYDRGFLSDCVTSKAYLDRVSKYATRRGWSPSQGDALISH